MNNRIALIGWLLMAFALVDCNSAQSQERSEDREVVSKFAQLSGQFSAAYVQGDIAKLISFYSDDAVIFPVNNDLIRGREAIKKYWTLPPGRTVTHHKITAVEIKVIGEFAYDYGY